MYFWTELLVWPELNCRNKQNVVDEFRVWDSWLWLQLWRRPTKRCSRHWRTSRETTTSRGSSVTIESIIVGVQWRSCQRWGKEDKVRTWHLFFVDYTNHLNTGLVWYSNGIVSGCQKVQYSNGGLKTGLEKACLWSKMSGIQMVRQVTWLYHLKTGQPYCLVFRCLVYRWLLYYGVLIISV